jgi:type I restriction enzyme M protein
LDRFKLAGVIATWWTDTLPDFKTLMENGFSGVIDGWVDAIADAVEDDDAAGPTFDPFAHKLVHRIMADYLESIAQARAEVSRLKSEREDFEQSNPPDDADDEELASWNYAKNLERQVREIRVEHKDGLKALAKLKRVAAKTRATDADRRSADAAEASLRLVLDRIAEIEAALVPYERIQAELSEARSSYRELVNRFVGELRTRCSRMTEDAQRVLVLELFAWDVQISLDAAVDEKRHALVRFVESQWDKYRVTLATLRERKVSTDRRIDQILRGMRYV